MIRSIHASTRKLALAATLLALLGPSTGCNKLLANFSLSGAEKRKVEAELHEGDNYDLEGMRELRSKISAAQQQLLSGDTKGAKATAKEAADLSKTVLERVKELRAADLRTEANKWIGIMDLNSAKDINEPKYAEILTTNVAGQAAFEEQKWDGAIVRFFSVVEDSNFLLENLRRDANRAVDEVERRRQDLIDEGAPQYNPEAVVEIDGLLVRMREYITESDDYRNALRTRDQAVQRAAEGIRKTKELKSREWLDRVEDHLADALNSGAEVYANDAFFKVDEDLKSLLLQHLSGNYDSVMARAPLVVPQAQAVIVETHRNSAQFQMGAVDRAIRELTEGQAKIYLPGRVEQLESLLEQARERFQSAPTDPPQENWQDVRRIYMEAEELAQRAIEEQRRIIDAFDREAETAIGAARRQAEVARSVFQQMEYIFSLPMTGTMDAATQRFEDLKQALREELRQELRGADLQLGLSQVKREDQAFAESIEIAKGVVTASERVLLETYHVVAHNAIQEISNELTRYETDGGREYAAEELEKARAMLVQTRNLREAGAYREANSVAADTKSQVAVLAQEILRVAQNKIDAAQVSLELLKTVQGGRYAGDQVAATEVLIDEAERNRQQASLLESIKTAERAASIAEDASETAMRLWAEEEMRRADVLVERARAAGADVYAAETLSEAANLRRTSEQLYRSGDMSEAQITAYRAAAAAENALYARVLAAENQIQTAKRYGGWELYPNELADAQISAMSARDFLDRGEHLLSHGHARNAEAAAAKIALDARRTSFSNQVVELQGLVDRATRRGAGYYQIGDLSRVIGEIERLKTTFNPEAFDESAERLNLLEAQLTGILGTTPAVLEDLVNTMNVRLAALDSRGARAFVPELVNETTQKIKFAQIDFRAEKFHSSYQNARDALTLLDRIGLRMEEKAYDDLLTRVFQQFADAYGRFSGILDLGPSVMNFLVGGSADGRNRALAMATEIGPSEFRQEITDQASQISVLEPPPTRRLIHNMALEMYAEAKLGAGGFEKLLILDQFSQGEAQRIIQQAYLQVRSAKLKQQDIQRRLQSTGADSGLPGIRRIISGGNNN